MVPADAARGDDHGLRPVREVTDHGPGGGPAARGVVGGQDRAADAGDRTTAGDQLVDAVPEQQPDPALLGRGADPPGERFDHPRAGAPGDVEPGHRVAVPVRRSPAPLGPAHHREDPVAQAPQPGALLPGGEVHVRLRPPAGPVVLRAVERGAAGPVLPGQLDGVPDAHPPLLGRVDQEEPAERPPRLPAEVLLRLLVQQQHPAARVGRLGGGDQAGQSGADHDHIGIHGTDRT